MALLRKGKKPRPTLLSPFESQRKEWAERLIDAVEESDSEAILDVAYELDPTQFEEAGE